MRGRSRRAACVCKAFQGEANGGRRASSSRERLPQPPPRRPQLYMRRERVRLPPRLSRSQHAPRDFSQRVAKPKSRQCAAYPHRDLMGITEGRRRLRRRMLWHVGCRPILDSLYLSQVREMMSNIATTATTPNMRMRAAALRKMSCPWISIDFNFLAKVLSTAHLGSEVCAVAGHAGQAAWPRPCGFHSAENLGLPTG